MTTTRPDGAPEPDAPPRRRTSRSGTALLLVAAACAQNPARLAAPAPARAPLEDDLQATIDAAYERFRGLEDGEPAGYIPALAEAPPDRFGIVVATTDGTLHAVGDTDVPFAIMSAAKPFTAALLLEQDGPQALVERIGVEPSGEPFNSVLAVELHEQRSINPMVNAGAIAAVSLIEAGDAEERWGRLLAFYERLLGEELEVMEDVYRSVSTTNHRNRAIANLLYSYDRLYCDPAEALDVYNRQSCVGVTATQLAKMGATLANGGENPWTGERALDRDHVGEVLALMCLSGFYDESGYWAYTVGLPAKSGVGGGIVAVVPGRMAIAAFSPRLNQAGNSVRGSAAIAAIATELQLSLFDHPPGH